MLPTYTTGNVLFVFSGVCLFLLLLILGISWLVRKGTRETETYECGMEAEGNHRTIGFNFIGYAVLFLVFDLAALYLFLFAMTPNVEPHVTYGFIAGIVTLLFLILYATHHRRYYVA